MMGVIQMGFSMTGYGRDVLHIGKTTITAEVRSVNHRYLDISVNIPHSLLFIEDRIKQVIKSRFGRGRIEVYVNIAGDDLVKKQLQTDWDLMDQYINEIKATQKRYNLSGDIPATILADIPQLISIQEVESQPTELIDSILMITDRACEHVLTIRKQEGSLLIRDVSERVHAIQETVFLLKGRQDLVFKEYSARIQARLTDHIGIDETRLYQEVALLAEKGDITEEVTRLLSHTEHFLKIITEENDTIGRTLDFIVQEMHREINTIGAKSLDTKTSEWIVLLKGDIEKTREQIQNIE